MTETANPTETDTGDSLVNNLRPQKLSDFIGQNQIRDNLKTFIEASKSRNDAMDHVLFYGPPGLGKTTLAQIIASELGCGFRMTSGPVIAKAGDLAALLTNLQPRDVLFIDEIHRLNPAVEEVLYPAMEDFQLDLMIGEGVSARSVRIDLPPFTLVGATTRAGRLTNPLRDRFGILCHMNFYETDDLSLILRRSAKLVDIDLDDSGAAAIACRSRGTPRIAGRLLRRVRDIAEVEKIKKIDAAAAIKALQRLKVDDLGLDDLDRQYLSLLQSKHGGGPTGVETLAAALGNERDVIEELVEPFLLQSGLIQRTQRGRMLCPAGWQYLGLTAPGEIAELPLDKN